MAGRGGERRCNDAFNNGNYVLPTNPNDNVFTSLRTKLCSKSYALEDDFQILVLKYNSDRLVCVATCNICNVTLLQRINYQYRQ